MKTSPPFAKLAGILAAAVILSLAGCGKKEEAPLRSSSSSQPASTPEPAPMEASAPPPPGAGPAPAATPTEAVPPVAAPVQSGLEKYVKDHGKMPENITELIEKGYLKEIPKTPNGQFMIIDPETGRVKVITGA